MLTIARVRTATGDAFQAWDCITMLTAITDPGFHVCHAVELKRRAVRHSSLLSDSSIGMGSHAEAQETDGTRTKSRPVL